MAANDLSAALGDTGAAPRPAGAPDRLGAEPLLLLTFDGFVAIPVYLPTFLVDAFGLLLSEFALGCLIVNLLVMQRRATALMPTG